jgi:hypothetical protein
MIGMNQQKIAKKKPTTIKIRKKRKENEKRNPPNNGDRSKYTA